MRQGYHSEWRWPSAMPSRRSWNTCTLSSCLTSAWGKRKRPCSKRLANKHHPVRSQLTNFTYFPRRLTKTKRLPDSGSSSNTLLTNPTKPSMDFRKSTGLLYARIRRTSGVNHILLPSHPQPYAVGELHLHRPGSGSRHGRLHLHKLPLAALGSALAPVPLLKGP